MHLGDRHEHTMMPSSSHASRFSVPRIIKLHDVIVRRNVVRCVHHRVPAQRTTRINVQKRLRTLAATIDEQRWGQAPIATRRQTQWRHHRLVAGDINSHFTNLRHCLRLVNHNGRLRTRNRGQQPNGTDRSRHNDTSPSLALATRRELTHLHSSDRDNRHNQNQPECQKTPL